jgi:hypothetical protein
MEYGIWTWGVMHSVLPNAHSPFPILSPHSIG